MGPSNQLHHRPLVHSPVDRVSDGVGVLRRERPVDGAQGDPQEEVHLLRLDAEPRAGRCRQLLLGSAAEQLDRLDDVGVVSEGRPDASAPATARIGAARGGVFRTGVDQYETGVLPRVHPANRRESMPPRVSQNLLPLQGRKRQTF